MIDTAIRSSGGALTIGHLMYTLPTASHALGSVTGFLVSDAQHATTNRKAEARANIISTALP